MLPEMRNSCTENRRSATTAGAEYDGVSSFVTIFAGTPFSAAGNARFGTMIAMDTTPLPVEDNSAALAISIEEQSSTFRTMRRHIVPTLKYLCESEVHTYAFSVAACVILSMFPAIVLMLMLAGKVFDSPSMVAVILQVLREYMPSNQNFIASGMSSAGASYKLSIVSGIMLFVSCTGVFLPLEVALNQVWGIKKSRSYLMNQVVSLGLALGCGLFGLGSVTVMTLITGSVIHSHALFWTLFVKLTINLFTLPAMIACFFWIYWLLPNGKVRARDVFPASVVTGVLFEVARHLYVLALPLLDFRESYGPFSVSVTLIFWSYINGLLLLGGAHLSAAGHAQTPQE
jgi:YihY family inner membrane protein